MGAVRALSVRAHALLLGSWTRRGRTAAVRYLDALAADLVDRLLKHRMFPATW